MNRPGFGAEVVFERSLSSGFLRCSGGYAYLSLVRETEIKRAATLGPNPKLLDLFHYFAADGGLAFDSELARYSFAAMGEDLLLGDMRPEVGVLSPWHLKTLFLQRRPECTWQNYGSRTMLGQDLREVRITAAGETWYSIDTVGYKFKSKMSVTKKLKPTAVPGYFSTSGLQPGDYDLRLDVSRPVWWRVPRGVHFAGLRQRRNDWVCITPADTVFLVVQEAVEEFEFLYGVHGTDLELVDKRVLSTKLSHDVRHEMGYKNHYAVQSDYVDLGSFLVSGRHPQQSKEFHCADSKLKGRLANLVDRGGVDASVHLVGDRVPNSGFLVYDASDSEFVSKLAEAYSAKSMVVLIESSHFQAAEWAGDRGSARLLREALTHTETKVGFAYTNVEWGAGDSADLLMFDKTTDRLKLPKREGVRYLSFQASDSVLVVAPPGTRIYGPDVILGVDGSAFILHVSSSVHVPVELPPGFDSLLCAPLIGKIKDAFKHSVYFRPQVHVDSRFAQVYNSSLLLNPKMDVSGLEFASSSVALEDDFEGRQAIESFRLQFDTGGLKRVDARFTTCIRGVTDSVRGETWLDVGWFRLLPESRVLVDVPDGNLAIRFPVTGAVHRCRLDTVQDVEMFDCYYDDSD